MIGLAIAQQQNQQTVSIWDTWLEVNTTNTCRYNIDCVDLTIPTLKG